MEEPTKQQKKVLAYYGKFQDKHGYCPSLTEVASHFKWASTTAAYQHVKELVRKGYMERLPKRRGFRVAA